MTDIQPMFIFTIAYLSIFFSLMGLMPILAPNLLYGGKAYNEFDIPENFSTWDIENIKYYLEHNLTFPHSKIDYDFNSEGINVKTFSRWDNINPYLAHHVITWEFWVFWKDEQMVFTDLNNTGVIEDYYLGIPELNIGWDSRYNSSIFTAKAPSGILKTKMWYMDTNNTRNNITQAFIDGAITLGVGFGIDDVETSYSAFSLIGIILTFQQPHIFGASGIIALTLNLMCNIPVFLSFAYLIYYFILSIIPFIRGA